LILKRRDVGVVDRARLESDSGDAHRATLKHIVAQSIQRLDALKYSSMWRRKRRCSSLVLSPPYTVLTQRSLPLTRTHTDGHGLVHSIWQYAALGRLIGRRRRSTAATRNHEHAPEERGFQEFRGAVHSARTSVFWGDRSNTNAKLFLTQLFEGVVPTVLFANRYEGVVDTLVW